MIPAEAAKALLDHLAIPKQFISVWIHRAPNSLPGANPELHVAINPEWKRDRFNVPGQFNNYKIIMQPWSMPLEGEALNLAEKMMEPTK